jgi:hypothetical protein
MAKNRYSTATAAEKQNFTDLVKTMAPLLATGLTIKHRELREEKNPKYILALGKNKALVYTVEFRLGEKNSIKSISLLVSRVTLKSNFGKALIKAFKDAKECYGSIVFRIPVEKQESVPGMLETIGKLIQASDELELDPKRNYLDPPQGWVDGLEDVKPSKVEKPVAETTKEAELQKAS